MYYNEEVQDMKKKAILCIVIFIVIMGIGLLFIFNRFGVHKNVIVEAIKKEESFVIYFNDRVASCEKCDMVKERLDEAGVSYYNFNIRSEGVDQVLARLDVGFRVVAPSVFVVLDGKLAYNIVGIQNVETIDSFIKLNKLTTLID